MDNYSKLKNSMSQLRTSNIDKYLKLMENIDLINKKVHKNEITEIESHNQKIELFQKYFNMDISIEEFESIIQERKMRKNNKEIKENNILNIEKIKNEFINNNLIKVYDKEYEEFFYPIIINYYNKTVTYIKDNNKGEIVLDYVDTETITKKFEELEFYINTFKKDSEDKYIFKKE